MLPYRIHEADLLIAPDWQNQSLQVFKLSSAREGKVVCIRILKQREHLKEKMLDFRVFKLRLLHPPAFPPTESLIKKANR